MKITFLLAGMNLAGGTRVVLMIAEGLRLRGHDVLVVYPPAPKPPFRDRLVSFFRKRTVESNSELGYLRDLNLGVNVKAIGSHRAIVDSDLPDADVVVATFWMTANWVWNLSPLKGTKLYFIQQYEVNFGHPESLVGATWKLPIHKIVCSNWLSELARVEFGDDKAIVVENGIDTTLFYAPERGKQPRPTIGFLYAPTHPVKGTGLALRVFARLKQRVPHARAIIFGADNVDPRFPLPEDSVYRYRPPQSELRDIYTSCDVWFCCSTSEGFHLPPHEAMACRCPVVSTRVGGSTELIRDGVNGYLTDVGDEDALVERLITVITAPEENWKRLSDAALSTATEFSWERAALKFERALMEFKAQNQTSLSSNS